MALKAIKIRIYPNREQQEYLAKLLGSCRFIYNNCLAYKIEVYNKEKRTVGWAECGKYMTALKQKEEFSWLKEVDSRPLQQSLIDLESAYSKFFKNGKGFPKFKSRKDNQSSCRFSSQSFSGISGNRLTLIKALKDIYFKSSRNNEVFLNKGQNKIRSATLTKTRSGKYFLSVLIDKPITRKLPKTDKIIGIDLGIKDFVVTSDNQKFESIKIIRSNEKKLAKLQRNHSKKKYIDKKPSKNKEKTRIKLAKFHEKLSNIKENYLHHVANKLLNDNQVIVIENLSVQGMMKNHSLARSIQELSLSRFKQILKYKAPWYGRDIVEINRFYPSSKTCSCCGFKNDLLTLKDREWACPSCKAKLDRDLNAATNILNEGKRFLLTKKIGVDSAELKLVENNSLECSMKQEKNVDLNSNI